MQRVITESELNEQLDLEAHMRGWGREIAESKLHKATEKGRLSTTEGAQAVIRSLLEPFVAATERWLDEVKTGKAGRNNQAAKVMMGSTPDVVCFIALKTILDGGQRFNMQRLAIAIGANIEDERRFSHFKKEEGKLYRHQKYQLDRRTSNQKHKRAALLTVMNRTEVTWRSWTQPEKMRVGTKMIDLLIASTGFVTVGRANVGTSKEEVYCKLTDAGIELLEKAHDRAMMLSPVYLPTIIPPKPWTKPYDGGYWETGASRVPMIKVYNRNYLSDLANYDMPEVYQALNTVQETAWRVNTKVLEVAQAMYEANAEVGELPPHDHIELPPKPSDIETNETARKAWRKDAASIHNENRRIMSKRLSTTRTLQVAHMFADREAIWFPHQMDFRGRVYAVPLFLNPQGNGLAKGLLEFSEGKPLGEDGGAWLAVHGANVFGYDKVSLEDRIQWVLDHEAQIIECANDPYANRWWTEADGGKGAWLFLAFCYEWAAFCAACDADEEFYSHLPVALDGSCNGLQNLSAALRDEVGGAAVNMIPSDVPSDIYRIVADKVNAIVDRDAAAGHEYAKGWQGNITRKVCKRPVMTLAYGATKFGFRQQIIEDTINDWQREDDYPFGDEGWKAAGYLGEILWQATGDTVIKARELMDWFMGAASLVASEGLPVHWITPVGLPVMQDYRSIHKRRVDTALAGSMIRLTLAEDTDKVDLKRMQNGIAPNWVHSMDAAHLMKTVNLMDANIEGEVSIHVVHDSYGCHAADVPMLNTVLRMTFVEMYSQPVLETFRENIYSQLDDYNQTELEELPEPGNLDLSLVQDSSFFFA